MDGVDSKRVTYSSLRRAVGCRMGAVAARTRNKGWRSDSKLRALAFLVRVACFVEDVIEFARRGVALDLSIPVLPISFQQPVSQLGKFSRCDFSVLPLEGWLFAKGQLF